MVCVRWVNSAFVGAPPSETARLIHSRAQIIFRVPRLSAYEFDGTQHRLTSTVSFRLHSNLLRPLDVQLMWSQNKLTERLGLQWPISQAPMGSATTLALEASVSNAGGLGGLGMWGYSAEDVERRVASFRQQSGAVSTLIIRCGKTPVSWRGWGLACERVCRLCMMKKT
jgi:hypothetical protein